MSPTTPIVTTGAAEQETVNTSTIEYATKADIERIERVQAELKVGQAELKAMLQQLLAAMAASQLLPHNDSGYNTSSRITPELDSSLLHTESTQVESAQASKDAATPKGAPEELETSTIPVTESVELTTSAFSTQGVTQPTIVPAVPSSHDQEATPALLPPAICNDANLSTVPPTSSAATPPLILDNTFPILEAAIKAADIGLLVKHVDFPRPHMPVPIEDTVQKHRAGDLVRIHKTLSSTLLGNGIIGEHAIQNHATQETRVVYNRALTRSLSCAIEHFIAVAAMSQPKAKAKTFTQELRLNSVAVSALNDIVEDWSSKMKTIQKKQEEARPQEETDEMEIEETMTAQPAPQALPIQPQQVLQIQQPQTTQVVPSFGSNAPLHLHHQATSSPPEVDSHNEEMLGIEELEKLQPMALPHSDVVWVPDDLRHETIIELYRIFMKKNPPPGSPEADCRLFGSEVFEMAQLVELRMLVGLHQKIDELRSRPTQADVVEAYHTRRMKKCEEYQDRCNLIQGVKRFHRFARKIMKKARAKLSEQFPAVFGNIFRRGSEGSHQPSPPPVTNVHSVEIGMQDDGATSDENKPFHPDQATSFPVSNQGLRKQESDKARPDPLANHKSGVAKTSKISKGLTSNIQGRNNPKWIAFATKAIQDASLPAAAAPAPASVLQSPPPPSGALPVNSQPPSQQSMPVPSGSNTSVLTSDQLTPNDLDFLKQPSNETPTSLSISDEIRSETIVDFYDTLVDANTKIPGFKTGAETALLGECMLAGTAPFWDDFVPLSMGQLADMAKHFEDLAVQELQKKVETQTKGKFSPEMEYRKAASKLGISPTAKGMEWFATEAQKVHDREASSM